MSHNLDTTAGQTSFVSAREDAWHHLGQTLPDSFTAEEAMKHGLLGDWNIRKVPLHAHPAPGVEILLEDRFAVVRDNPVIDGQIDVLGDVGKAYHIIQNEELSGLLNALVDESGARFETAGAIDGGRKVFVTMKMPGHIKVGGVDRVDNYIAAMTSHDGSSATAIMVTPIRIVCQNTLNLAFARASNQFRVRHTVGAPRILHQQARDALDFTFGYLEGFQTEAEMLINTTLTQAKFEAIIAKEVFPIPTDASLGAQTRTQNKIDQVSELFSDAFTQDGVRETAWAGLNALTEWYDHFSPVRGGVGTESSVRSRKALLDPAFKDSALRLMMAQV